MSSAYTGVSVRPSTGFAPYEEWFLHFQITEETSKEEKYFVICENEKKFKFQQP